MGCGHLLIITILLVNAPIVAPGRGFDYIRSRSMGRDDRHRLCGETGTESSASNLHPPLRSYTRPSDVSISPEGQYCLSLRSTFLLSIILRVIVIKIAISLVGR